jgi:hypothetical protein
VVVVPAASGSVVAVGALPVAAPVAVVAVDTAVVAAA